MCFVMFLIIDIRADEELQDVGNLLGMWCTVRRKHINCIMIMLYELGLVFEKKNLDM